LGTRGLHRPVRVPVASERLRYVRTPTIADHHIVFALRGRSVAGRKTKVAIARRLTTTEGECTLPRLSPDGSLVAFVGTGGGESRALRDGTSGGGVPRRLNAARAVRCCTAAAGHPDGRAILFTSDAGSSFIKDHGGVSHRGRRRGSRSRSAGPRGRRSRCVTTALRCSGRNADRPGALEALPRRHGRTSVGRRARRRASTRVSAATSRKLGLADVDRRARLLPLRPPGESETSTPSRPTAATCARIRPRPSTMRGSPPTDGTRTSTPAAASSCCSIRVDGGVRRVAVEMPSDAPATARRFRRCSHAARDLDSLARRHRARDRRTRTRVHDAAVGRGGRRASVEQRARTGGAERDRSPPAADLAARRPPRRIRRRRRGLRARRDRTGRPERTARVRHPRRPGRAARAHHFAGRRTPWRSRPTGTSCGCSISARRRDRSTAASASGSTS